MGLPHFVCCRFSQTLIAQGVFAWPDSVYNFTKTYLYLHCISGIHEKKNVILGKLNTPTFALNTFPLLYTSGLEMKYVNFLKISLNKQITLVCEKSLVVCVISIMYYYLLHGAESILES